MVVADLFNPVSVRTTMTGTSRAYFADNPQRRAYGTQMEHAPIDRRQVVDRLTRMERHPPADSRPARRRLSCTPLTTPRHLPFP